MRRAWVGLALLSASWLFGLRYYHAQNWTVWAGLIVLGSLLLVRIRLSVPGRVVSILALVLLVPVLTVASWPYRVAPLLMITGLALWAAPIPRRWPRTLGSAAFAAGLILMAQTLGLGTYESLTARSHELPRPLALVLLGMARLLGMDAALAGPDLALCSVRTVHRLGATWELWLDPSTLCFLVGGVFVLGCSAGTLARREVVRSTLALALVTALWLPVRAALLTAVLMHRALRTEYEMPLMLMNQFWSPWVNLALLAVPVLLAIRFLGAGPARSLERGIASAPASRRRATALVLVFMGVFLSCFGWLWDSAGRRKEGRILVDEYHSAWEPTDRSFDTEWYGEKSGYNYACIYDYCSHFYRMGRLTAGLSATVLQDCDVLILKVPTSRYTPEEITTVERFVERGGGLLLIGEHTNVFKTGTHLNDIAQRFGFRFRHDCLFDIDTVFEQRWRPPLVPHPIVQNLPSFDFAVSCSIAPGARRGRAVIRSTGLRNLPADYHVSNFYPQVRDHAYSRSGAFIQLWTTRRGSGRVAAFADSTVFSNFCTFEPGKAELMLGMLEWLNHRNSLPDPRPWLFLGGLMLGLGGVVVMNGRHERWILLLAVGLSAGTTAVQGVRLLHHHAIPLPQPARSFVHVVMDRTVCDAPLSKSGFLAGTTNGFGIFERWILRLGYFTSRRSGPDVLQGDLVVFAYPSQTVTGEFRDAVTRYVASGGRVLVLDSPENSGSTANSFLYPFGLGVDSSNILRGSLAVTGNESGVSIEAAYRIIGGAPLMFLSGMPVAATARLGRGSVTVVGFGSRFTDAQMGVIGDVVPDAKLRQVFDLEFMLLRDIMALTP